MPPLSPPRSAVVVTVTRRMNDHGAMTVEVDETNETRHLVEYGSPDVRATLAALPVGATIPLELRRIGSRSNVWEATSLDVPYPHQVDPVSSLP